MRHENSTFFWVAGVKSAQKVCDLDFAVGLPGWRKVRKSPDEDESPAGRLIAALHEAANAVPRP